MSKEILESITTPDDFLIVCVGRFLRAHGACSLKDIDMEESVALIRKNDFFRDMEEDLVRKAILCAQRLENLPKAKDAKELVAQIERVKNEVTRGIEGLKLV